MTFENKLHTLNTVKVNTYQKVCYYFLIILVVYWIFLNFFGSKTGFYNYLYSFLFGLIPLIGGAVVLLRSKIWGVWKSILGKAVFFIGLGLFCWGFGETIWSYYNFFKGIPAPYPSLADVGFAPSILFYGIGAVYLSRATGAKFGLRNPYAKIFIVVAFVLMVLISYYVLVVFARGGVIIPEGETMLKTILDIAYPLGDFVSLTLAVIISGLSFRYFGGKFKYDVIFILVGLATMFFADTVFSYSTTVNTYYNGDLGDLMLTMGMFFLTFGALGLCKLPEMDDGKKKRK